MEITLSTGMSFSDRGDLWVGSRWGGWEFLEVGSRPITLLSMIRLSFGGIQVAIKAVAV